ncbi:MAG: arylsulfatase A-like enzyme [Planctomycetota bacterium]|jgi:arylsulfatase A-like enzyme
MALENEQGTDLVLPPSTNQRQLLAWLPLGLYAATLVAFLRLMGRLTAAGRGLDDHTPDEVALLTWELAHSYLPEFIPALVLSLIATTLVSQAARSQASDDEQGKSVSRVPLFVLAMLALLSALSGYPLAAEAVRAGFDRGLATDDMATCAGLSAMLAAGLFMAAKAEQSGHWLRPLYSGSLGLALSVFSVVGPIYWMWSSAVDAPKFTQRETAQDLLFSIANFEILEKNADAPPRIGVMTPNVENKTDSADKPALILPPPARARFTVDADGGPFVLRTAAGLDQPIRYWMKQNKRARCSVEFSVRVDGELVFEQRITSQNEWDVSKLDEGAMRWHHVGGADGLTLEAGSVVELETSIPPGDPAEAFPANVLSAGFGTLVLERQNSLKRTIARPDKPNVILIVMDTLRADRMSCYGYEKQTTPNLDALADRGLLFENAISTSSWTWPATASILTGMAPAQHGVLSNESCTLVRQLQSLAEPLQERGFTTAAFSCNPLISVERNFDQGFEFYDHDSARFRMTDEVMPSVMRWVRGHHGARFFLYLHLADPHTPHHPHSAELARLGGQQPDDWPDPSDLIDAQGVLHDGMDYYTKVLNRLAKDPSATPEQLLAAVPDTHRQWIRDQYDASVATGDRWLGVLFRELERLGLGDNTIVAFTSDHGEELFDHDLLEHGHTLNSELVHVPLILAGPGIPHGIRMEEVISTRHLGPSLARLGGTALDQPEDDGFDFLLGEEFSKRALFQTSKGFWNHQDRQSLNGIREDDWVLHWREGDQQSWKDVRLFQADVDPGEQTNVAAQDTARVNEMRETLIGELKKQRKVAPRNGFGIGASGQNTLRGMGYLPDENEVQDESETNSGAGSEPKHSNRPNSDKRPSSSSQDPEGSEDGRR